jgi:ATP-dependent RNA helicase RhlE
MTFKKLGVTPLLLKALSDKNYATPTPIQEQAIPLILQKNDILGSAQTGTGKTAAFAIPIIQLIHEMNFRTHRKPVIKALIVTPTRELAIQIEENIREYSKYTKVKYAVIFGGVKQSTQTGRLKNGVDILVATPGRLLDLVSQDIVNLRNVQFLVLDEADRMLDMGFIHDVKRILRILPRKRQSLFFSATLPQEIVELSRSILDHPRKVEVSPVSSTAETVQQYVYYTNKADKKSLLLHILKNPDLDQVLLFSRTKHGADKIAKMLKKKGIKAEAIHGDKAQNRRQKVLKEFKAASIRILVATDIAARGIDIDKLRYVINFDIPNVAEDYVHRIGRSGRAGEEGIAISLCEPEENIYIRNIEKLIKQKINIQKNHPFPQTDKPMNATEKKEWEKEKQRRKQEFFANRKKRRKN